MKNLHSHALDHHAKGRSIIPVNEHKSPLISIWKPFQSRIPTLEELDEWFNVSANIALVTGKINNNLAVLDIDDLELAERIKGDESLAGTLIIETPSGGLHIYLQEDASSRSGPLISGVADLKAEGGYVLVPPSETVEGEYTVLTRGKRLKVADARVWSLEFLAKYDFKPSPAKPQSLESEAILDGTRNDTLTSLGGALRRKGFGYDQIAACLKAVNETSCVPPLDADEVEQIARSVSRYDVGSIESALPLPITAKAFANTEPRSTKWLVDSILKTNGHHIWSGAPGSAKSWAAMDLGLAVASGQDFLGFPTHQGPVLFIDDDNIGETYKERLAWLGAGRNLDWPTLPIDFLVQSGIDLGQDQWVEHVIRHVIQYNIQLVIIEVLRRVFAGDENSSKDIGHLNKNLARIRRETGVTVVLTHHVGKARGVATRGSSDIDAMADVQLVFRKAGSSYIVREFKNRHRRGNREWSLELRESVDSISLEASGETTRSDAEHEETTLVEQCVDYLHEILGAGGQYTKKELESIAAKQAYSKPTFERAMHAPKSHGDYVLRNREGVREKKLGKELILFIDQY